MKRVIGDPVDLVKSIFGSIIRNCQIQTYLILLLVFSSVAFSGCFRHYYKVNSKEAGDTAIIEQLKNEHKYFILHSNDQVMGAEHLNWVNDRLEADLVALPKEHAQHTKPKLNDKNAMKAKHQSSTLTEVHLYSGTTIPSLQSHISLPKAAINRVDVYEMDESATRQSHILSTVGFSAAGIIILGVLVLIITGGLVASP